MFIVKYYLLGAIASFILAALSPTIYFSIPFVWIGVSLSAVSAAYILQKPKIFRKKIDGSLPFYTRWIFIPFLFGCQLYNAWQRKTDKVPPIQQIDEHLFLACRLFPSDVEFLKESKVKAILDVTAEFDGLDWTATSEDLDYLNIPVLDHQAPEDEDLVEAVNWLDNQINRNRGVVVHCALGRGRSVLVMAAYLLSKDKDLDVEQAIEKINGIRSTAGLNSFQMKKLRQIHQQGKLRVTKKLAIIANPVSGGGKWPESEHEVTQRLSAHFALTVYETTPEESASTLAQKAIDQGAQIIVGCGGDGTINEVASKVVNSDLVFGIMPMGTANALSHAIYGASGKIVPVEVACDTIINQIVTTIDTARCNDEMMLLVTAIGFEQQMIESADREQKNEGGQLAYIKALFMAIEENKSSTLTIQIDDEDPLELETSSLVVANAAPFTTVLAQGGGEPDMTDGKLDVTWLPANASYGDQIINLADLAFTGLVKGETKENINHRRVTSIKINSNEKIKYVVDGENREADAVNIEVKPMSLKIFAPVYA